jgi:hypothetical protein
MWEYFITCELGGEVPNTPDAFARLREEMMASPGQFCASFVRAGGDVTAESAIACQRLQRVLEGEQLAGKDPAKLAAQMADARQQLEAYGTVGVGFKGGIAHEVLGYRMSTTTARAVPAPSDGRPAERTCVRLHLLDSNAARDRGFAILYFPDEGKATFNKALLDHYAQAGITLLKPDEEYLSDWYGTSWVDLRRPFDRAKQVEVWGQTRWSSRVGKGRMLCYGESKAVIAFLKRQFALNGGSPIVLSAPENADLGSRLGLDAVQPTAKPLGVGPLRLGGADGKPGLTFSVPVGR